ncbi:hypothetical protein CB1_000262009 [Camelus ferus]|nr:hypothetical protein CB1_000262009 [Camelus ferus]
MDTWGPGEAPGQGLTRRVAASPAALPIVDVEAQAGDTAHSASSGLAAGRAPRTAGQTSSAHRGLVGTGPGPLQAEVGPDGCHGPANSQARRLSSCELAVLHGALTPAPNAKSAQDAPLSGKRGLPGILPILAGSHRGFTAEEGKYPREVLVSRGQGHAAPKISPALCFFQKLLPGPSTLSVAAHWSQWKVLLAIGFLLVIGAVTLEKGDRADASDLARQYMALELTREQWS